MFKYSRTFYKLLSFDLLSKLGSSIFMFGATLYIYDVTQSVFAYTIVLAISMLVGTLAQPFIGYISDFLNNQKIITISQTVSVLSLILYLIWPSPHFILLAIVITLLNLIDSIIQNSILTSMKRILYEDEVNVIIPLRQSIMTGVNILSPIVGGFMFAFVPFKLFVITVLITECISMVLILLINFKHDEKQSQIQPSQSMFKEIKAGFQYVLKHKVIRAMLVIAMTANLLFSSVTAGIPKIFMEDFSLGAHRLGIVEGSLMTGMFIGGLVVSKISKQLKLKNSLVGGQFVVALVLVSFSFPYFISMNVTLMTIIYAIITFILGLTMVVQNTPFQIYLHNQVEEHMKGRMFSVVSMIAMFVIPLGLIAFGMLYTYIPLHYVLFGASGLLILSILLFGHQVPNIYPSNEE